MLRGKVLLIYKGEPLNKKQKSRITGSNELSDWSSNPYKKLELAKAKGAKAVLIIEDKMQKVLSEKPS